MGSRGRAERVSAENLESHESAARIERLIVSEKYSPDTAVAQYAKENNGKRVVSTRLLYSYMGKGFSLEREKTFRREGNESEGDRERSERR